MGKRATWRRKRDGRPYIDVVVGGNRMRTSLLPEGWRRGTPYPTDAECEALFCKWVEEELPALQHTARLETECGGPDPSLASLANWYIDTYQVARGDTEATRLNNKSILGKAFELLRRKGVVHVSQLTGAALTGLAAEWQHLAPATRHVYLSKVKAVIVNAYEHGLFDHEPPRRWPRVKCPPRDYGDDALPDAATLRAFLDFLDKHSRTRIGPIARFMALTGMRPSDAAALLRKNVDFEQGTVFLRIQKTQRLHTVTLCKEALHVVEKELVRTCKHHHREYVFLSKKGTPFTCLSQLVRLHAERFGVPISAKTFRYFVVSTLYDAGCDDGMVSRITGHASVAVREYRKIRNTTAKRIAEIVPSRLLE